MDTHKPNQRNIWLLATSYGFAFTATSTTAFLGGIIGTALSPSINMATLPIAMTIIGTAIGSIPAAMIMNRIGRRAGFISASIFTFTATLICAVAIWISSFWVYCAACTAIGIGGAFVQQYRFAAAENAARDKAPQAISFILLAGIAGGFLGPSVSSWTYDLAMQHLYVGSYLALSLMTLIPAVLLLGYQNQPTVTRTHTDSARSSRQLLQQPAFLLAVTGATISYAIMTFLMTATPISMHVIDHLTVSQTGIVIQWHIVGMFLPSLITGHLIQRFGYRSIMLLGIVFMALCISISQFSQTLASYWCSLICLGIGWNCLFVSGTSLLIQCYQPSEQFRAQACNDFMVFSCQALASLLASPLMHLTSWKTINLLCLPLLLCLAWLIFYTQLPDHERPKRKSLKSEMSE